VSVFSPLSCWSAFSPALPLTSHPTLEIDLKRREASFNTLPLSHTHFTQPAPSYQHQHQHQRPHPHHHHPTLHHTQKYHNMPCTSPPPQPSPRNLSFHTHQQQGPPCTAPAPWPHTWRETHIASACISRRSRPARMSSDHSRSCRCHSGSPGASTPLPSNILPRSVPPRRHTDGSHRRRSEPYGSPPGCTARK
jgi:hypothetical protein